MRLFILLWAGFLLGCVPAAEKKQLVEFSLLKETQLNDGRFVFEKTAATATRAFEADEVALFFGSAPVNDIPFVGTSGTFLVTQGDENVIATLSKTSSRYKHKVVVIKKILKIEGDTIFPDTGSKDYYLNSFSNDMIYDLLWQIFNETIE